MFCIIKTSIQIKLGKINKLEATEYIRYIYKFILFEFKNKPKFLNYLFNLLKNSSLRDIEIFYLFLQTLNIQYIRPIKIKYFNKKHKEIFSIDHFYP